MRRLIVLIACVATLSVTGIAVATRVLWGRAVYYSNFYAGRRMACGRIYQPWKMVAAHRSLPCGSRLRVTNRANGRTVIVTVRDRGPYGDRRTILDVSRRAAIRLRFFRRGWARVRVTVLPR